MPTYEFRCPDGHQFDKFYRSISASEMEVPCPQCGSLAARQISGGAGLQFKGSGFYLTDYGKNAHRGGAAPASGGSGDSKGGESKGGESKGGEGAKSGGEGAKPASGGSASSGSSSGGSTSSGSSGGGSSSGSSSGGGSSSGSGE